MYIYKKKILYSDIDANSNMSIEGIMDAIQDCININSEAIGKGIAYMHSTKKAWFAISWNIEVKRFPKLFKQLGPVMIQHYKKLSIRLRFVVSR